jgi:hypothetical protein
MAALIASTSISRDVSLVAPREALPTRKSTSISEEHNNIIKIPKRGFNVYSWARMKASSAET